MSTRIVVVGVLVSVVVGVVGVSPATSTSTGNPWEAGDRLGRWLAPPSTPGWRAEAGLVTRESVPEEWEGFFRAGFEKGSGPGVILAWRKLWNRGGPSADDIEAHLVFRASRARVVAGGGMLGYGSERVYRGTTVAHVRILDSMLAGMRLTFFPGDAAWETGVVLRAVHGPWLGGLERGPGAGSHRISVGLRLSSRLVWSAAYAGSSPSVGISWRGLGGEFRAETTQHPLLGSITSVRWVVGGLAP